MMRRVALLGAVVAGVLGAQVPSSGDTACRYQTCALVIEPVWNGLALTRGIDGPRVASLSFFWPRSVTAAMIGPERGPAADSVGLYARRALRVRRRAALLTDGGLVSGAVAVALRLSGEPRQSAWFAIAGGAMLGVSVPLQFAADGALSRAVWWHNTRFAP